MSALMPTSHFFCLSCHIFLPTQEISRAHSSICPCPNIQCIALIPPTPAPAGNASKEKKEVQKPSAETAQKAMEKIGSVRIHGNESVVINNYF